MQKTEVSKSVLKRLPAYLSYLKTIPADGSPNISATNLASALGMGEVQVRKDLALVSSGGRPKVGYNRLNLIADLEQFLGYDNTTDAVVVGAGKLGQALMDYRGFDEFGLHVLAGFDIKPEKSHTEGGRPIYNAEELGRFCQEKKVLMGILTVPNEDAQDACDYMIACGIQAIWSFASAHLEVPEGILVQYENMATSFAVLSMHLQAQIKEKK